MLLHLSILWAVINISCSPEVREYHPWPQQGNWGTEGCSDLCTIMQWLKEDTKHWTRFPESFLTVWMSNFAFIITKPEFSFLCKQGWRGGSGGAALWGEEKEELKAVTDRSKCQWKLRASLKSIAKASQVHRRQIWVLGMKRILLTAACWQGNCSARSFWSLRTQLSSQVTEDFTLEFTSAPSGPEGKSPTCHDRLLNLTDRTNLIKMDSLKFECHASALRSSCCSV